MGTSRKTVQIVQIPRPVLPHACTWPSLFMVQCDKAMSNIKCLDELSCELLLASKPFQHNHCMQTCCYSGGLDSIGK